MLGLLARLWKMANHVKDAWEWYVIVAFTLLPAAATLMLGILEGQPWSVLFLYSMAIAAFVIVLLAEGRPLIAAAAEKLRVRERGVKIVWGAEPPFVHQFVGPGESKDDVRQYRLFRIGVRNIGTKIIDRVEVDLEQVDPNITGFSLPVRLHLMHDNTPPYKEHFVLDPGERQFVDVVQRADFPGGPYHLYEVCHIVSGITRVLPSRNRYRLKIAVHGAGMRRQSMWFSVSYTKKSDQMSTWEESVFRPTFGQLES